jgi:hypothetical protein
LLIALVLAVIANLVVLTRVTAPARAATAHGPCLSPDADGTRPRASIAAVGLSRRTDLTPGPPPDGRRRYG